MSNPALEDDLGKRIIDLALIASWSPEPNKFVHKAARRFQRESSCKITRNVMERICQYRSNCARLALETYDILRNGDY